MPRLALLTAVVLCAPLLAHAHNLAFTDVRLRLQPDAFVADVVCDLDALALGVASTADSAALAAEIEALDPAAREALVERLLAVLKRRLRVRFDGTAAELSVGLPERGLARASGSLPSALGLVARLSGAVPPGAREVTFFASRAFPPVRLQVVRASGGQSVAELVTPGAESRPVPLAGPVATVPATETARRFLALGITHILPYGFDHVLFVAGLTLLGPRIRPLLAQVTAFTLAHTLTLALASYGVVRLPPQVVEPLIALSIAYVGLENALSPRLRASRLAIVFAFGLLHGLGFAGVLGELGLPQAQRLAALVSFNLGVEIGQLAVIALVQLPLLGWKAAGRERAVLVRAASLAIAGVGLLLVIERLAG